jgi:hypothetical protein
VLVPNRVRRQLDARLVQLEARCSWLQSIAVDDAARPHAPVPVDIAAQPRSAPSTAPAPPAPQPPDSAPGPPAHGFDQLRRNNGAAFRSALDVFFRMLNPLHPVLNENLFRSQFDRLVFGHGAVEPPLLALALLIQAEVSLLQSPSPSTTSFAGWHDFCRAERVLAEASCAATPDLALLQYTLLKARYTMYLRRFHQARTTVAAAVRICLQLRLHDETQWAAHGVDAFDTIMRQRVFWSLFTLDRSVSVTCGSPPLLSLSNCRVQLPPAIDDRSLFPNQPLPAENPERCSIPYLHSTAKWGEIWDQVWTSVVQVDAWNSLSQQTITALDATIVQSLADLPTQLRWQPIVSNVFGQEPLDSWLLRQRILHHMRMNALRLLLRQEYSTKAGLDNNMARDVVAISRDTVVNVENYSQHAAQSIDRHFITVYLSGLLLVLGSVVITETILHPLQAEAAGIWIRASRLLKEIARNCALTQMTLTRFQAVTDILDPLCSSLDKPSIDGNADVAATVGAGLATADIVHTSTTPTQWYGVATDPDFWRIATW